jgi:hypothetical protein
MKIQSVFPYSTGLESRLQGFFVGSRWKVRETGAPSTSMGLPGDTDVTTNSDYAGASPARAQLSPDAPPHDRQENGKPLK